MGAGGRVQFAHHDFGLSQFAASSSDAVRLTNESQAERLQLHGAFISTIKGHESRSRGNSSQQQQVAKQTREFMAVEKFEELLYQEFTHLREHGLYFTFYSRRLRAGLKINP